MILSLSETISAPRELVWHYLTDPQTMSRWMAGVEEMRTADGHPLTSGSQILFITRGKTRQTQVTEFEPMHRLIMRSTQGPVTAVYAYTVGESRPDDRTPVKLEADCTARGWVQLMLPFLKMAIRRADGSQLSDLKRIIESDHRTSVTQDLSPTN
ncbi:MAG: SRPBCC family protein [Alphaproteobacteria bacterium]|nr:SRPBCC family protein [Alphaproteobacteria bacterium]